MSPLRQFKGQAHAPFVDIFLILTELLTISLLFKKGKNKTYMQIHSLFGETIQKKKFYV